MPINFTQQGVTLIYDKIVHQCLGELLNRKHSIWAVWTFVGLRQRLPTRRSWNCTSSYSNWQTFGVPCTPTWYDPHCEAVFVGCWYLPRLAGDNPAQLASSVVGSSRDITDDSATVQRTWCWGVPSMCYGSAWIFRGISCQSGCPLLTRCGCWKKRGINDVSTTALLERMRWRPCSGNGIREPFQGTWSVGPRPANQCLHEGTIGDWSVFKTLVDTCIEYRFNISQQFTTYI